MKNWTHILLSKRNKSELILVCPIFLLIHFHEFVKLIRPKINMPGWALPFSGKVKLDR